MASPSFFYAFLSLFSIPYLVTYQQNNYEVNKPCHSLLIYNTQPPTNTISTIASFFSANPSEISAINNISENKTLATNTKVMVPVMLPNCGLLMKKKWRYFWSGIAFGTTALSVIGIILFCVLKRKFHLIARKHGRGVW